MHTLFLQKFRSHLHESLHWKSFFTQPQILLAQLPLQVQPLCFELISGTFCLSGLGDSNVLLLFKPFIDLEYFFRVSFSFFNLSFSISNTFNLSFRIFMSSSLYEISVCVCLWLPLTL